MYLGGKWPKRFSAQYEIIISSLESANLTYLFQPLDVQDGSNGYVKRFTKKKFCDWYADQITQAMEAGQKIEVPL